MEKQIRVYEETRGEEGLKRRVKIPVEDFKEGRKKIIIYTNSYIEGGFILKDFGYNCIEIRTIVNKLDYIKLFVSNKEKPITLENEYE